MSAVRPREPDRWLVRGITWSMTEVVRDGMWPLVQSRGVGKLRLMAILRETALRGPRAPSVLQSLPRAVKGTGLPAPARSTESGDAEIPRPRAERYHPRAAARTLWRSPLLRGASWSVDVAGMAADTGQPSNAASAARWVWKREATRYVRDGGASSQHRGGRLFWRPRRKGHRTWPTSIARR